MGEELFESDLFWREAGELAELCLELFSLFPFGLFFRVHFALALSRCLSVLLRSSFLPSIKLLLQLLLLAFGLLFLSLCLDRIVFVSQALLLFPLPEVVHVEEWNGTAVVGLDEHFGCQGAGVLELQLLGGLLTEYDISEIDNVFFDRDERLLTGANQWDIDLASLTQDREEGVDVLVQLGREGDRYRS